MTLTDKKCKLIALKYQLEKAQDSNNTKLVYQLNLSIRELTNRIYDAERILDVKNSNTKHLLKLQWT